MHYNVSMIDTTTRYEYTFDDNTSCVFLVNKAGVIYIEIKESIPFEVLSAALDEVSNMTSQKGLKPTIHIKNSNIFLKILAKKTKFKEIPTRGISFSVWVRR